MVNRFVTPQLGLVVITLFIEGCTPTTLPSKKEVRKQVKELSILGKEIIEGNDTASNKELLDNFGKKCNTLAHSVIYRSSSVIKTEHCNMTFQVEVVDIEHSKLIIVSPCDPEDIQFIQVFSPNPIGSRLRLMSEHWGCVP